MKLTAATVQIQSLDAALKPTDSAGPNDLSGNLTDVLKNAMEVADAQLGICTLKITRSIFIAAFGLIAMAGLTVLAIHGFFLLDSCLAYALSPAALPIWFSPLVRGLFYVLGPAGLLCYIWQTMAGSGD